MQRLMENPPIPPTEARSTFRRWVLLRRSVGIVALTAPDHVQLVLLDHGFAEASSRGNA